MIDGRVTRQRPNHIQHETNNKQQNGQQKCWLFVFTALVTLFVFLVHRHHFGPWSQLGLLHKKVPLAEGEGDQVEDALKPFDWHR